MGMQVSCGMDTEVSEEDIVRVITYDGVLIQMMMYLHLG